MRIEVAWLCTVCGLIQRIDYDLTPEQSRQAPICNHHGRKGTTPAVMMAFHVKDAAPAKDPA